uniref:Methyltranfer_dom domain-containing protein n=1 Tax=Steinernema glaseri TaxID=37863 RepID=A0A1I7YLE9_9BILA
MQIKHFPEFFVFFLFLHYLWQNQKEFSWKPKEPPAPRQESDRMEAALERLEDQRQFYELMFDDFVKGRSPYNTSFVLLANLLREELICDNLIRFGSKKDGGHWICNPHTMLKGKCSLKDSAVLKSRIENDLNGRYEKVRVEEVGNPDAQTKGLSDLFIENGHRTIDILKVDQTENVKTLIGSIAGLYDIHHIVARHSGRPDNVARYIASMSDLHYSLYSWEFDHRQPNTVITSHIANKEHNSSEFSAYHGQFYSIPMQLPPST